MPCSRSTHGVGEFRQNGASHGRRVGGGPRAGVDQHLHDLSIASAPEETRGQGSSNIYSRRLVLQYRLADGSVVACVAAGGGRLMMISGGGGRGRGMVWTLWRGWEGFKRCGATTLFVLVEKSPRCCDCTSRDCLGGPFPQAAAPSSAPARRRCITHSCPKGAGAAAGCCLACQG